VRIHAIGKTSIIPGNRIINIYTASLNIKITGGPKMRSRTVLVAVFLMFSFSVLSIFDVEGNQDGTRAVHIPISISGNSDLVARATSEGWSGTGTYNDPYIIENFDIDAGGSVFGIRISGTDRHVTIRNCRIFDADYRGEGTNVKLSDSRNISLLGNTVTNSRDENIQIDSSSSIQIDGNTISGSKEMHGIQVTDSQNVDIGENYIRKNELDGVNCDHADDLLIDSNSIGFNGNSGVTMANSMFGLVLKNRIEGNEGEGMDILIGNTDTTIFGNIFLNDTLDITFGVSQVHISSNNTIDGRPIYHYRNADIRGSPVPWNASMVLAYNVTGLEISGVELDHGGRFVYVYRSDNITISGVDLQNVHRPIEMNSCQDVIISNCEYRRSRVAIFQAYCRRSTVSNNLLEDSDSAISTYYNWGPRFENNNISRCVKGFDLTLDRSPILEGNRIDEYGENGIYGYTLKTPLISRNFIENGSIASSAILLYNMENGLISWNRVSDGTVGLQLIDNSDSGISESRITANIIENHLEDGIRSGDCGNLHVNHNILFDNLGFGINLTNCGNSKLWANTLIGNMNSSSAYNPLLIQARDDGTSNLWHLGGWGNYWADWTGPDSDKDGLVDPPYIIRGGDNYDLYPLAQSEVVFLSEPLNINAKAGNANATISWKEPGTNLDDTIIRYNIRRTAGETGELSSFSVEGNVRSFLDTGLENGMEYRYIVTAENSYGEGRPGSMVAVTPDGSPPMLYLSIPEEGSFVNTTMLTVKWNGEDDESTVRFEWSLDGSEWSDAGNGTSVDLVNLTEGRHTFHLACIDEVGNRAEVNGTILVDLTAPVIWFRDIDEWKLTNTTTIDVEWNWSEENGILAWVLELDGAPFSSAKPFANATISGLKDGTHTFTVTATDAAGNRNHTSAEFMVDTTAPVILITRPSDGLNTLNRTILATWIVVENGAGIDTTNVRIDEGNWTDAGSFDVYLLENMSSGVHSFSVRCRDLAGNTGEDSVDFDIFEDELHPEMVTVQGHVTNENGEPISGVRVSSDDGGETTTDTEGFFILVMEKGIRKLTFEKKGYIGFEKNVEAEENVTLQEGDIVLKKEEDSSFDLRNVNRVCLFLCFAPFIMIVILILFGVILKKIGRREVPEE